MQAEMTSVQPRRRGRVKQEPANLFPVKNRNWRKGPVMVDGRVVDLRRERDIAIPVYAFLRGLGFKILIGDLGGSGRGRDLNAGQVDISSTMPDGRSLYVELKRPKAPSQKYEKAQREFMAWARDRHAVVIEKAESVEHVRLGLVAAGFVMPGTAGNAAG